MFLWSSMSGLHCYCLFHSRGSLAKLHGSTWKGIYQASLFVPPTLLAMFVHLCACCGLQCNYRSLNKRFQDLLVQLYQIHATCKCTFCDLNFYICYVFCNVSVFQCQFILLHIVLGSFAFWKVYRGDLTWKSTNY